ncbi:MAG: nitrite/sulfite reductase [Geobacteraceae bacterium]|nr:nitrite/sulfite reductase [Geobacteraceae bacterium]
MTSTITDYRLDGIYKQRQDDFYMQRVKLPAGVISAVQARTVAAVATRFGQGMIHLTSRGSMEIHWLHETDLPQVKRELAMAGLTARGACGGAVRGITCASQGTQGFPILETLARRLHRHFTGNPRFERLPKKFKIGIEADTSGGRHLIQDVGLVLAGSEDGRSCFDIWIAGGLGKEPRPGFLMAERIAEERIIPIIEAVVAVYARHAPPPKRLKFLAAEFGEAKLRQLIEAESVFHEELPLVSGLADHFVPATQGRQRLELPVFAGQLTAGQLEQIIAVAEQHAEGVLMVTANQDIALLLAPGSDAAALLHRVQQTTGLAADAHSPVLRICSGNHECRMGLTATRALAREILADMSESGQKLSWALSGCHNSCSQPQLADVGIVTSSLVKDAQGERIPRFDLYRRGEGGLGNVVERSLTRDELIGKLKAVG